MRRLPWMQIVAYALLALAVAATALAFASLRVMNDQRIPGAGPGYRYYALGMLRSTGPDFSLDTGQVKKLDGLLPGNLAAAAAVPMAISYVLPGKEGAPIKLETEMITGAYIRTLHLRPLAGRAITEADLSTNAPVIMLGEASAKRLFGGARQAIGRALRAGPSGKPGVSLSVIGVLPANFGGIVDARDVSAWLPYTQIPALNGFSVGANADKAGKPADDSFLLTGFPALLSAPADLPLAAVRTQVQQAWQRLPAADSGKDVRGIVLSAPYSFDPLARLAAARRTRLYLALSLAALALATVNLFTLRWLALLRRRSVLQMERVLGATRSWLRRRFLTRTAVTAALTLALSAALAGLGYVVLKHLLQKTISWGVLGATAVARQLVWILPGLLLVVILAESLPLLIIMLRERLDGARSITISRGDRRLGMAVLSAEVLLAALMSCAAAWALIYAWQQRHADLGIFGADVTVVTIERAPGGPMFVMLPNGKSTAANMLLLDALGRSVAQVRPGARTAIGPIPSHGGGQPDSFSAGKRVASAYSFEASPDWLYASDAHLLAGRNFDPQKPDSNAVLIDASVARALFGDVRAAPGQTLQASDAPKPWRVMGVIAPMYLAGPGHDPRPVVIGDVRAGPSGSFRIVGGTLLVRPRVHVQHYAALREALTAVLKRQAPLLEVGKIRSSDVVRGQLAAPQTRQAQIFVTIALFAWAIALSGVAAHLRLFLAMRKRLTAIRSALGAGPLRLYREVVLGTLALAAAGVLLALLATPWLAAQFAFLSGAQVAAFGAATWIALGVLLLAVFAVVHFPARRAAHAEPAESLHEL